MLSTIPPEVRRRTALFTLGLFGLLYFLHYAYGLGLSRGFEFDDLHNFVELTQVHDFRSALVYALNGDAGPLGRPLSLLTFAAQAYAWPNDPSIFLQANILLHLINTVLVCWVSLRIARIALPGHQSPEWIAVGVAALWGASPLLASASLLTVQRMTTLSATFVLIGVLAHLLLLEQLPRRPRLIAVLLPLSLALFTVLGSLAKENGALLPLLVLSLHLTLLPLKHPALQGPFRYWPVAAFVVPAVALLSYFLFHSFGARYVERGYTVGERLLTESRVLFNYLDLLLIPVRSKLGPYHDDYVLSTGMTSPASTLGAVIGLVAMLVGALMTRRRLPVLSFGILWFVFGHLLESTVVPLELYFEHRNYVPAFGPLFALAYGLTAVPAQYRPLGRAGLICVAALSGFVLTQTTTVWGDQRLSAELWYSDHPDSERATQNLAEILSRQGEPWKGSQLLMELSQRQPKNVGLALQVAYTASQISNSGKPMDDFLDQKASLLRAGIPSPMICQILDVAETDRNSPFTGPGGVARLGRLTAVLLENPLITGRPSSIQFCIQRAAASVKLTEHDLAGTMLHLERAFAIQPTLGIALQMVAFPASAGLFDQAKTNLNMVRAGIPSNPLTREAWTVALDHAAEVLDADARAAKTAEGEQAPPR